MAQRENVQTAVVKAVLVDPILVGIGEFTTHALGPILVGIESDVHWNGPLTQGQMEANPRVKVDCTIGSKGDDSTAGNCAI